MTVLELVPDELLEQPKMAKYVALAEDLQVPDKQFFRLMAHAPGYTEALFDAMYKSHAEGNVEFAIAFLHIELPDRFTSHGEASEVTCPEKAPDMLSICTGGRGS